VDLLITTVWEGREKGEEGEEVRRREEREEGIGTG
jgi:hypothetical protein